MSLLSVDVQRVGHVHAVASVLRTLVRGGSLLPSGTGDETQVAGLGDSVFTH